MHRVCGEQAKHIIKKWEGLGPRFSRTGNIVAYLCPAGKPTIGWGHTRGVTRLDVGVRAISMEQAEAYLAADLRDAESYVSSIGGTLNSNQFDALVSAAFNLGSFGHTLVAMIRTGKLSGVPKELARYIHADPGSEPCAGRCGAKGCTARIEPGLITRRAEEAALFNKKETPV